MLRLLILCKFNLKGFWRRKWSTDVRDADCRAGPSYLHTPCMENLLCYWSRTLESAWPRPVSLTQIFTAVIVVGKLLCRHRTNIPKMDASTTSVRWMYSSTASSHHDSQGNMLHVHCNIYYNTYHVLLSSSGRMLSPFSHRSAHPRRSTSGRIPCKPHLLYLCNAPGTQGVKIKSV